MGTLFLMLMLFQAPELHRGPAVAEMPQITIRNDGPLVIPTDIVVRGLIGIMAAYTSLLILGGKWIWKKRGDEVAEIKTDVEAVTQALEKVVTYDTYHADKIETRAMISAVGAKVDHHHEIVMAALMEIHERRNGIR